MKHYNWFLHHYFLGVFQYGVMNVRILMCPTIATVLYNICSVTWSGIWMLNLWISVIQLYATNNQTYHWIMLVNFPVTELGYSHCFISCLYHCQWTYVNTNYSYIVLIVALIIIRNRTKESIVSVVNISLHCNHTI